MSTDSSQPRTMTIYGEYLDRIEARSKTIEIRCGYPNNLRLRPGQALVFVNGDRRCPTRIVAVNTYGSITDLLDHEDHQAINGGPTSRVELDQAIREIYPPEKERLGILAIHVTCDP